MKVKTISLAVLGLILLAFMAGCAHRPAEQVRETMTFQADFSIEHLDDGIMKVTDSEDNIFLLVPEGQVPPAEHADLTVINTPVESVLLTSTTQAGLLSPLNVWDSVDGVAVSADQWHIDEITDGLENGSITYVGESWAPDYEKIRQLNPEIVFVYSGDFGLHDMMAKLDEMQIKYVVVNDYMENDPRVEMEWIVFMSAFYNKYDDAVEFINNTASNIEKISQKSSDMERPLVAWGFIFDGMAHVPNAGSHSAAMIRLAGGEYAFDDIGADQGGSSQISIEEFYSRAKDADVLIYSSILAFTPNVKAVIDAAPVIADINPIIQGNVWAFTPAYFQNIHQRDLMIEDLASIFHPGEFEPQGFYVEMPEY